MTDRIITRADIQAIAAKLADLQLDAVLVGGCATPFLLTDPSASEARGTVDVDFIIRADSYARYVSTVAERLRLQGFYEDSSPGAPLCRWRFNGLTVDLMPHNPKVLGFDNRWYEAAFAEALSRPADAIAIRIISASYFLATKIQSFLGRGRGDYLHSDLEDIIAIVDGRPELVQELPFAPPEVRAYVSEFVRQHLREQAFHDAVAGFFAPDAVSQERTVATLDRLAQIASLAP